MHHIYLAGGLFYEMKWKITFFIGNVFQILHMIIETYNPYSDRYDKITIANTFSPDSAGR